jgi:hypothetical protein
MGDQGTLFDPTPTRRRRRPPKQITVIVSAEAIAAVTAGRFYGERVIAAAIRVARPETRNIVVDLGTIRWTNPKTSQRVTFDTPAVVRKALLGFASGAAPEPFRFILGRATQVKRGD